MQKLEELTKKWYEEEKMYEKMQEALKEIESIYQIKIDFEIEPRGIIQDSVMTMNSGETLRLHLSYPANLRHPLRYRVSSKALRRFKRRVEAYFKCKGSFSEEWVSTFLRTK